eukprot:5992-Rhodomonas_salina.2
MEQIQKAPRNSYPGTRVWHCWQCGTSDRFQDDFAVGEHLTIVSAYRYPGTRVVVRAQRCPWARDFDKFESEWPGRAQ